MLKVGELEEFMAKRDEANLTAKLEEFTVNEDATELRVQTGFEQSQAFLLDETATAALGSYLKVPASYLNKVTPDFKAQILRYEFDRNKEASTVVEALGGKVVSFHQPTDTMLPLNRVSDVITKVMQPEDTVRRLIVNDKRFHVDVTTPLHAVNVAALSLHPVPEVQEGDITEGGLRILAYPFQGRKPSVVSYLERLVCTNGMTQDEKLGAITLKGNTVDEVIYSMEMAAQELLAGLDEKLSDYADTKMMTPPGSPQAFAAQLAREANLTRSVLDKVLDIINQLPAPVSVWDVNQAFTSVANQVETYGTMTRLQTLGGSLAMDTHAMIERCSRCEQLLHG